LSFRSKRSAGEEPAFSRKPPECQRSSGRAAASAPRGRPAKETGKGPTSVGPQGKTTKIRLQPPRDRLRRSTGVPHSSPFLARVRTLTSAETKDKNLPLSAQRTFPPPPKRIDIDLDPKKIDPKLIDPKLKDKGLVIPTRERSEQEGTCCSPKATRMPAPRRRRSEKPGRARLQLCRKAVTRGIC
jgi:hypothetical protein